MLPQARCRSHGAKDYFDAAGYKHCAPTEREMLTCAGPNGVRSQGRVSSLITPTPVLTEIKNREEPGS
jgi:hypothetical protein